MDKDQAARQSIKLTITMQQDVYDKLTRLMDDLGLDRSSVLSFLVATYEPRKWGGSERGDNK